MKFANRKMLLLLILVFTVLFLASQAHAEEAKEKNFFLRLWDRVKAWRSPVREAPAAGPQREAPEAPQKKKAEEPEEKPERRQISEEEIPPKAEMIDKIKKRLDRFPEILDVYPSLSFRETAGVKEYFYVTPEGVEVELASLDDKTLYALQIMVSRMATQINTERIMKMLQQQEQIRRMQNLQQQVPSQPPSLPAQPPTTPQVYTPPPQVPRQTTPPPVPVVPATERR